MFNLDKNFSFLEVSDVLTTIDLIRSIITNPKQLYYARRLTEIALKTVPDYDFDKEMSAILKWVKNHFKYTRDIKGIETVKTIEKMYNEILVNKRFIGDCDDVSTLISGMLISIGYNVRLVIVSTLSNPRNNFNHIFVQGYNKKLNVWRNLDGTLLKKDFNAIIPYKKIKIFRIT